MARNVQLTASQGVAILAGPDREDTPRQQTIISTTAETPISPAADPNAYYDLYSLRVANSSAAAVVVDLRDSAGGAIVDTYAVGAGQTFPAPAGKASLSSSIRPARDRPAPAADRFCR